MTLFISQRQIQEAEIQLSAPIKLVFPLFEPMGERNWVPGWEPVFLYPTSCKTEVDAVFLTTNEHTNPVIWTIMEYQPEKYFVRYLRVVPEDHIADICISCTEINSQYTQAKIKYVFTGLSEAGNTFVAKFTQEQFKLWIHSWETSINYFLNQNAPFLAHHPQ